jgi:drug/metabolite transporter (DMT)-like permease
VSTWGDISMVSTVVKAIVTVILAISATMCILWFIIFPVVDGMMKKDPEGGLRLVNIGSFLLIAACIASFILIRRKRTKDQ